jgi:hypothetical protein
MGLDMSYHGPGLMPHAPGPRNTWLNIISGWPKQVRARDEDPSELYSAGDATATSPSRVWGFVMQTSKWHPSDGDKSDPWAWQRSRRTHGRAALR